MYMYVKKYIIKTMFYFLKQYFEFLRFVTNISFQNYLLKTQYKILIYNELAISHNKVTFVIFITKEL